MFEDHVNVIGKRLQGSGIWRHSPKLRLQRIGDKVLPPPQQLFSLHQHSMASRRISRAAVPLFTKTRPAKVVVPTHTSAARCVHQSTRLPAMAASNARSRPTLQPLHQPSNMLKPAAITGSRSIFIQTENTPNPDALKFLPNSPILPPGLSSPFLEYLNPRATLAPPHPSPLAAHLMNIDGVISVFYGADFITVTKAGDVNWAHIKPEVFSLITEAVTSGAQIVNVTENKTGEQGQEGGEQDSLAYDENDSEVVGMIKELLETRIRPSIQEDGGDIEFRGFEDGQVLLKLRGACRTCDSSTVTLKNGIEGMLMHYVSIPRKCRTARMLT
jgi:Fe-S cluster biogenesis protein NfuA